MSEKKLGFVLTDLRHKFLTIINDFYGEDNQFGIFIPMSALIGTTAALLTMSDINQKFGKEILEFTEQTLIASKELLTKLQDVPITKN